MKKKPRTVSCYQCGKADSAGTLPQNWCGVMVMEVSASAWRFFCCPEHALVYLQGLIEPRVTVCRDCGGGLPEKAQRLPPLPRGGHRGVGAGYVPGVLRQAAGKPRRAPIVGQSADFG